MNDWFFFHFIRVHGTKLLDCVNKLIERFYCRHSAHLDHSIPHWHYFFQIQVIIRLRLHDLCIKLFLKKFWQQIWWILFSVSDMCRKKYSKSPLCAREPTKKKQFDSEKTIAPHPRWIVSKNNFSIFHTVRTHRNWLQPHRGNIL